ncbi:outer membrane assembly lipoprotein yfio [hydrocarbon metagenome]|uniref:Outer membrane assembly lipoprotein yfio n=1 Tax=hydrocarbon metagenome TaxID=938273 RepID=A0A0W8G173_9ZZZZ
MKLFLAILAVVLIVGCSGGIDTTLLTPDEHFNYALELFQKEDYQDAQLEFQSILLQYPGSAVNDDAQYYLGLTYFRRGQYLLAAYEFSKLIRDIPASEFVPDAQYMLAESYYQLSPPFPLDQSYSRKAIEEFQAFIDYFPLSPKVAEAEQKIKEMNDKLAEKLFSNAVIYEKMSYYKAAIKYYGDVYEIYHDTRFGPLALLKKIQLEISRDEIASAKRDINKFLAQYPDHESSMSVRQLEEQYMNQ